MDINQARELLQRYRAGECTMHEKQLVEEWYNQLVETGDWQWSEGEKTHLQQAMEARLLESISQSDTPIVQPMEFRKNLHRKSRWLAAASIILLLGAGAYLLFSNKTDKPTEIVRTAIPDDVKAPETNRATIILASGQKVYLDSALNGTLAMQGNVKLVKLANGQIAYQGKAGKINNEIKYNTLTNPRGSKVIDMTLADGTKVWLNTGSSVTYPVSFDGKERNVSITGEAYFEVAHNAAMPFKVTKNEMKVIVLGTHFNVNAYDDEPEIKVTLLKGSVKVIRGTSGSLLKFGQQAQVTNEVKVVNDADLEQVMAWKNGYFNFNSVGIRTIMKQLSRWYDVDVNFEGNVPPQHFTGEISRDVNASEVLKMLEYAGVHFRIEGTSIVVMP